MIITVFNKNKSKQANEMHHLRQADFFKALNVPYRELRQYQNGTFIKVFELKDNAPVYNKEAIYKKLIPVSSEDGIVGLNDVYFDENGNIYETL